MVAVKKLLENGAWKGWLLGIVGTLIATAVTNGIIFQRQVKEQIAHNEERLKVLETQRLPIARDQIVREFARQDKRIDNIVGAIGALENTHPTNTEVGQQLRQRDLAIQHLEQRIERLEKR
jgi:hypothetical protein